MAAAAQARGIRHVDTPVAGTKPQAQNAELVFIVGGDPKDMAIYRRKRRWVRRWPRW